MAYRRLGDILVDAGLLSEEQVNSALASSKTSDLRLGEYLVKNGVLTEMQIIDALSIQLGMDFIDLSKISIDPSLTQVLPKNIAKAHSIVPVRKQSDTLYIAMSDPLNFRAVEEAKSASRCRVVPMISTREGVERAIASLYGNEGVNKAITELQSNLVSIGAIQDEIHLEDGEDEETQAPTIRLIDSIIERAVVERASDIHFEPNADSVNVRMRIDGMLRHMFTVPKNLQSSVTSRIKVMSNMDIAERRIPQDGRANVRAKGKEVDLRVSTLPTNYGEKIVIRLLEKSSDLINPKSIGLTDSHLAQFEDLIKNTSGVILVAGPTGSGKSTTIYAMISSLNSEAVNIVTLEDPIEYDIDGVNQVQINEKVNMTFASALRSVLRQDPDIISVGEIRDGETAEIAMSAAITGHLVLSTIHTNNAIATLDRLQDIGVEAYLTSSALKGIIAQRLVRTICPNCREAYTPSAEELEYMHIDSANAKDVQFYHGKGCPECMNTGYYGRHAIFEILTIDKSIKDLIRKGATVTEFAEAARAHGFKSMFDDCRRLVLDGVTTVEESSRVLHTTDD
jgi:type IV pilus assembly protein PilB